MRVWTVSFILFFILTELYQWLEGIVPPFPVFVGAGALLAIASNASKWTLTPSSTPSKTSSLESAKPEPAPKMPPKLEHTKGLSADDTPELPALEKPYENPFLQEPSISFTIHGDRPKFK